MQTISLAIEPKINGTTPGILVGITIDGCTVPSLIKLSPAEARAFGLQLKVLADSIDRMIVMP